MIDNWGYGFGLPRPLPERREGLVKQVLMAVGLLVGVPVFLLLMWALNVILVVGYGW